MYVSYNAYRRLQNIIYSKVPWSYTTKYHNTILQSTTAHICYEVCSQDRNYLPQKLMVEKPVIENVREIKTLEIADNTTE